MYRVYRLACVRCGCGIVERTSDVQASHVACQQFTHQFAPSFPQKREPGAVWIPAFAGMTEKENMVSALASEARQTEVAPDAVLR